MDAFKQDVLTKYLKWVEEVSEDCEWKTHFSPDEIVSKVVDIVLAKLAFDEHIQSSQELEEKN